MKKHNLILSTAIAMAFGLTVSASYAGTLAGAATNFAVENFGSTTTATTGITPGAVTYTISTTNGIVINAGGTIYVTVRLTNGTFAAAPAGATLTGTALAVGGGGNGVPAASVLSTDKTTAMFPITYTAAATLGVGSTFIFTPTALSVTGVNTTLATVGGTVSATVSMSAITPVVQSPSATTSPNTGTAQAADIDAPAATAVMAKASQGIATAISALATDTAKIDLTATPPSSLYTVSTGAPTGATTYTGLGSVTFTDATTAAKQYDGVTNYNTAAAVAGLANGASTIVVTPGTSQSFPIGSKVYYDVADATCATQTGASATLTAATATKPVTLTMAVNPTSGTVIYVCMTSPSATNTATPITATIAATLPGIVATDANDTGSGTGYALNYNGSQVDMRSYIPAAVAGFTSFARVINTGSVGAQINVAVIDATTGTPGTSVSLTSLAAGAARSFSSTEIEAAVGAVAAASRPRLRFTAPTNGMNVQSFIYNQTDASFTDLTGAQ